MYMCVSMCVYVCVCVCMCVCVCVCVCVNAHIQPVKTIWSQSKIFISHFESLTFNELS